MSRRIIGIVDYGVGNIASIVNALSGLNYSCRVVNDPDSIRDVDLILLPGVGSFPRAMSGLRAIGFDEALKYAVKSGRPILGICLGMQLLADRSYEVELTSGLGLITGDVIAFPESRCHIGWNQISTRIDEPGLVGFDGLAMYFNHSFFFKTEESNEISTTRFMGISFPAIVRRENVIGVQFHPEKSQTYGSRILYSIIDGLSSG